MNFPINFFPQISFTGEAIADILFLVISGFTAIISAILFFHWKKYGMGGASLAFAEVVYIVGAVSLIAIAFFALGL